MAQDLRFTFQRVTASICVTPWPCWYQGAVLLTSVNAGDASVYNGRDSTSGKLFETLKAAANDSRPVTWPQPIYFGGGLYVAIGSNVSEVTVSWAPANSEEV